MSDGQGTSRGMLWTGRVLTGFVALGLIASASMKLTQAPEVVDAFKKFGYPDGMITTIAALELLSVVLFLIPQTAVLGAVVVTGYLGGAIATHVRVGEPAFAPAVLAAVAWGSIYLRDARLRALLPFRKTDG